MSEESVPHELEVDSGPIRTFLVEGSDLAELERIIPLFADELMLPAAASPRMRTNLRRVQAILSNVRWNYGPAQAYGTVDCGDDYSPTTEA